MNQRINLLGPAFLLEGFMADYRDKLDEWREAARRKARELDDKYKIKDRVEEGGRAAREATEKLRGAGRTAGERANEVFGGAKKHYERAARVYSVGSGVTRAT